jgi:hypothetical protein|tara:strand:- start:7 stop:588 length:582 start_codon:yes stop_codon:yes gene_type:complete
VWAKLNEDKNAIEEIITKEKVIIVNDIKHPKDLFALWTDAEKEAIGIVPVTTTGTHLDINYYVENDPTYAIADDKASVVMTIGVKNADKPLADLKSTAKNKSTTDANNLLKGFDWLISRKVTANTALPSDVVTYMAAIRTDHKAICNAIDGASDLDAFIALHTNIYDEAGNLVTEVARVNRWTSDANVKAYRR